VAVPGEGHEDVGGQQQAQGQDAFDHGGAVGEGGRSLSLLPPECSGGLHMASTGLRVVSQT
jgi:hypothetical protein